MLLMLIRKQYNLKIKSTPIAEEDSKNGGRY